MYFLPELLWGLCLEGGSGPRRGGQEHLEKVIALVERRVARDRLVEHAATLEARGGESGYGVGAVREMEKGEGRAR